MHRYSTFDIFDTVLTRRTSRPIDVFTLLAERLKTEGLRVPPVGVFRELRIRCERWSRRFVPSYEVELPEIYLLMGRFLLWTEQDRLRAAEVERELEASVLARTPHGTSALVEAREAGRRIAFVSDMYLESGFLRSVLIREGLFQDGDDLAVSGEWKVSKASGQIWEKLISFLGVEPEAILHQGDNPHSDVESPRRAGLSSARLGTAEPSRWEEAPDGSGVAGIREYGGLAALSRLARAECSAPDDYWTCLGSGVLGPMLAGFVRWTLDQARQDGVETLWFLSRDGWLFYQAAQLLAKPGDARLVYLGINRRQLQLALGQAPGIDESSLFDGSRSHTLGLVGSRLALDAVALARLAVELGVEVEAVLDRMQKVRLIEVLLTPEWERIRTDGLKQASIPARGYLDQEFAKAPGRIGVVDVGWKGRSQDLLDQIHERPQPLQGYYLGLTRRQQVGPEKKAWLYDLAKGEGAVALDRHERLFEVLVGGVSGPLRRYIKGDGAWQPDFEAHERGESAPGREEAQAAAMAFVSLLDHERYREWWSPETLKDFAICNLNRLFERATPGDARQFLNWTISTDEAHLDSVPLAQGYDFQRICACLQKKEPWGWIWPRASLQNSPGSTRWLMQLAAHCNHIRAQRGATLV